jgi:hypothetical protein
MTFKLTGPRALVALVVIGAIMGLQFFSQRQALQTQALGAIKTYLVAEYTRQHLPELQQATMDGTLSEARADQIAAQLTRENIDIVSISAHGHSGRCVARIEIRVAGSEPPDGKTVRYLRMSYSVLAGWRVLRDTNRWSYYLSV